MLFSLEEVDCILSYNGDVEERFHHRLKEKMKENNLSARQLSLRTGITEAAISKYLSGSRTPHLEAIGVLAKELNTTSDYLLGIEKHDGPYEEIAQKIRENKEKLSSEEKMSLILLISEK